MTDLNPKIQPAGAGKVRMTWTPDPSAFGYRFYVNDHPVSKSSRPGQSSTTFSFDGQPTAYGISASYEHPAETVIYPASSPVSTPRPTWAVRLTPNFYSDNDGPDANYQACWIGPPGSSYQIDRTADDRFCGALLWKPKAPWPPRPASGNWGRVWNFHNTPDDNTSGYGWSLPPGNSAFALDFYDGKLILNVEPTNPNNYTLVQAVELGRRYTIAVDVVWGRNDSSTARPGAVKVWVDGVLVLDLENVNTVYKWANGEVQKKMLVWTGHYTQAIQNGVTLDFELAWPWMNSSPQAALSSEAVDGGPWAISNLPIPGRDHTLGPATCTRISDWTTADLILPDEWKT